MHVKISFLILIILHLNYISLALNQEGLHLLQVKLSLSDPTGSLSGWSHTDVNPCNWNGITCNNQSSVVSVILSDATLSGPFPIFLCRLPSLATISLPYNFINSSLPLSISSCRSLVQLDLSQNLLVGPLPSTLADLQFLRYVNLEGNNFSGEIPASFGLFRQLETLILMENLLTGTIPVALSNITSMKNLVLAYNPFTPAHLVPEFGNLTNLEVLWLSGCQLVGLIPASYGRLSRLRNIDVSNNGLYGPIPSHIFQLKSTRQMEFFNNSFTGMLPEGGWSNLTELRRFDASMNKLIGTIPNELCELPLESLNLYENQLEGMIPECIANSPNLSELKLFSNQLTGSLPRELGRYSPLRTLDVTASNLSGEIPEFLCQNGALKELILLNNSFSGTIPVNLGKCRTLARIRLGNNMLYGQVPAEFWGLPHVYLLELNENVFSGNMSHLISGAKNLSKLIISKNKFSGSIPSEIGLLDTLAEFSAYDNELSGEIPTSIVKLGQLGKLDLRNNDLYGRIPMGIQFMKQLNELSLANNKLSGHIPDEIGNLPVLNYLDLSQNNLSGSIPLSLQNLKLNKLNLSSNLLSGNIPPLFTNDAYKDSFLENPGLCVDGSGFCNSKAGKGSGVVFSWVLRSTVIIVGIVFLVGIIWFLLKFKKLKKVRRGPVTITKWTSFHKLAFDEFKISDDLKETNVIGQGASGKVYKVVLSNGDTVAVKKLHERSNREVHNFNSAESDDEFDVEVNTLGKIRHKNIVKLWCCCSSGNCKLLVYEYMPNGSLGDLLHSNKSRLLDWPSRFKIALDAAEGLSYLHHDSVPPIVHRDVKSNNILLDEDFRAKISDFGVAKVVKAFNKGVESMSAIAGSCGYIAPEYAYTLRVNEKSDIYSFGVVIFELVTGKQPVDPGFGEKDLATWVCTTLDWGGINHVVDPNLDSRFKEHISNVLNIGMLCTSTLPMNRPSMRRVVHMLQELAATMPTEQEKDGNISIHFDNLE